MTGKELKVKVGNAKVSIIDSWMKRLEFLRLLNNQKPCIRWGIYEHEKETIHHLLSSHSLYYSTSSFKVLTVDSTSYSNKGIIVPHNHPQEGMTFFYISSEKTISEQAKVAEQHRDSETLGKLLGYPACCIRFFTSNEQAKASTDNDFTDIIPGILTTWHMNTTKRSKDICLMSHFPCNHDCQTSKQQAEEAFELLQIQEPEIAQIWRTSLQQ